MTMFLVWCLQATALIVAGALLAPLLKASPSRLWFWQGLILLALLLPLIEPWTIPPLEWLPSSNFTAISPLTAKLLDSQPTPFWTRIGWTDILIAGAILRLLWLGAGLGRLRQLRKNAERIAAPISTYSGSLKWYVSDRVTGPVTFGWTRPSILLPTHVCGMPRDMQHAIALHELRHVERGDWLFVILEEIVRSIAWFHPAIWYALGQVQLAREQVVDEEVVSATRDRSSYLEALVAVAAQRSGADLAPAPLFLKKRQLAARVSVLLKETPMSKLKMFAHAVSVGAAVALVFTGLVTLIPFQSEAQSMPDSPGITVDPGAPLAHRSPIRLSSGITETSTVIADAKVNAKGVVTDVSIVSGPDDLRKAVLTSVLDWHYLSQPVPPTTVRIAVTFAPAPPMPQVPAQTQLLVAPTPPPIPPPPPPPSATRPSPTVAVAGGRGGPVQPGQITPPVPPFTFTHINYLNVSPALEQEIRRQLPIQEGQSVNMTLAEIQAAVRQIDEHLMPIISGSSQSNLTLNILLTSGSITPPPQRVEIPSGAVRVSPEIIRQMLVTQIKPHYPDVAKLARIQGTVKLDVLIGPDGHVIGINVLEGPGMLRDSAMDAVRQWVYKPFLLNGQPTTVITQLEVNFALM